MKIAYIILAYHLPNQLVRMVNRLDHIGAGFYIHIDKRTKSEVFNLVFSQLHGRPNVFFLRRHDTPWGKIGCIKAMMEGIQKIVESEQDFDFVLNLSGQDYPIKSNVQIQETLQARLQYSFLRHTPIPIENYPKMEEWILYRHYYFCRWHFSFPKPDMFENPTINRLWNPLAAGIRIHYPLPEGMRPFYGSAYWCLNREAVLYVYNFLEKEKSFVKKFSRVQFPDEFFFQTILMNSPIKVKIDNENYRFIDFSNKKAHPKEIVGDDLQRLLSSNKLFARKFDMTIDNQVLDALDASIGR